MIHWLTQSKSPTHERDGGGNGGGDDDDDSVETNRKVIEPHRKKTMDDKIEKRRYNG